MLWYPMEKALEKENWYLQFDTVGKKIVLLF